MKKQLSIFSCSALVLAILASCSSNTPIMNTLNKVDSIKVSQLNKVQASENGTVKVNLRLNSTQPKFGIKAVGSGWVSNNNVSKVVVNLYDMSVASGSPGSRFNANLGVVATQTYTPTVTFSAGIFNLPAIKFNNLKAGKNYTVSARAYTSNFNLPGALTVSGTSGASTLTLSAAPTSNTRDQIFIGDILTVGGTQYTVTALGGTTLTVRPVLAATYSGSSYTVESNITGIGALGGSMAADGNQLGGGTAGGLGTTTPDEEGISVTGAGVVSIANDGTFKASAPDRAAGPNQTLDIAIQLMKDYGGFADGAIRIYQGGAGDPEQII
ncbi:MAG: hypothetical protein U0354_16570 [Candidatus Sericytochromatia bacterium]